MHLTIDSGAMPGLFAGSPRDHAIDQLHIKTAVYTASSIVTRLLARLNWPDADRCLLDPSCGDGIFLDLALRKLLSQEPAVQPARLLRVLHGWEIHPCAAQDARKRLAATLIEHGWSGELADTVTARIVVNADFLTEHPEGHQYDFIAGNPPYLRYVNVPSLLRQEYEAVLPLYARGDLLHSFLARCVELLKTDGELAMVTADRWLFNAGAAHLREMLGCNVGISYLERLDPDTCFYRPKHRKAGTPPRVHPVAVIMGRSSLARPLGREAVYPDAAQDIQEAHRTLGDIATVRIAPWLGKEGVFVVDADTARKLPPDSVVPVVDTDDIKNGVVQIGRRFAIRTLPGVEPPSEVLQHLRANLYRLSRSSQRNSDWWLPPETFHRHSLDQEALLIPRIATGLKCVRLPRGVLAINHNLTIVTEDAADLRTIKDLLSTAEAYRWVLARAPRLENGYCSITTRLLRQLPV